MRLQPPKPPYAPDVAAGIDKWMAGATIETPAIFEAFHIHPDLARRTGVLGAGFLGHPTLDERDREIVIDRVTGRQGAAHEWSLHASIFGSKVGLTEAQLDSTVTGPDNNPELWAEDELQLMRIVDELADSTDLGDDSWAFLRDRYSDQQLVEFILLVGWYRTVSSLCNTLRIPEHPECRPFPSGP